MSLIVATYVSVLVGLALFFGLVLLPCGLVLLTVCYFLANAFSLLVEGSIWIPYYGTIFFR